MQFTRRSFIAALAAVTAVPLHALTIPESLPAVTLDENVAHEFVLTVTGLRTVDMAVSLMLDGKEVDSIEGLTVEISRSFVEVALHGKTLVRINGDLLTSSKYTLKGNIQPEAWNKPLHLELILG